MYAESSPNQFYDPVFIGYFLEDTCTYIGLPFRCYEVFDSILFNQNNFCQRYSDGFFSHGSGNAENIFTANNVDIFFRLFDYFGIGYSAKDSIVLIGFTNSGILIGDSILTDVFEPNTISNSFNPYQNYPNPFNPATTIAYQIPQTGFVSLKVFDILGREVVTLVSEEKPAGSYEAQFSATNQSSGI